MVSFQKMNEKSHIFPFLESSQLSHWLIEFSQSQRPTVIEETREEEEELCKTFTKEELQEAEEIREKEVDTESKVKFTFCKE